MRRAALALCALALIGNSDPESAEQETSSEFVGRYDGSSFETAMGIVVREDGTWRWGVSVGALDMRAAGTWRQEGEAIHLTSDPKPIAPEFKFSGIETVEGEPLVRVVTGAEEEPFHHASAIVNCAEGWTLFLHVPSAGLTFGSIENAGPPPEGVSEERQEEISCDRPESIVLSQDNYNVRSETFKLAELGWEPGQTLRFAFHPNDLGVADFTGVTGYLEDGKLKLVGAEWPLEFRKLPPTPTEQCNGAC
ncbi:MAG: hypothetical protein QNJ15_15190 [Erythrobacter sp.]|nr:hypothetical protein [Erythrobacter sp.]